MLLAIILLIDIVLITSYCTTSRCCSSHSEIYANHVTKLAIILLVSFMPSYLPCLTRFHTHHVLLALILAVSYLLSSLLPAPSLTSYSSLCIVQLPSMSVTLRAALTMSQSSPSYSPHPTCYHPRHWCPHRDCHTQYRWDDGGGAFWLLVGTGLYPADVKKLRYLRSEWGSANAIGRAPEGDESLGRGVRAV